MQTLQRADVSGFRLTECLYERGSQLPRHSHPDAVLCYVLEGSFREDAEHRSREIGANRMLVRPADCPHSNDFAQGLRCLVVDVEDRSTRDVPEVAALLQRNLELGSPGLDRLMRRIVRSLRSHCPTATLTIEGLMLQALAESTALGTARRSSSKPSWLETVLAQLDDRFRDRIHLSELADCVGIHRIHLARTFRTHMGCTVGEYIRERRLEWAKHQLIATDLPISQIAANGGFADQSHLARLLRRDIGLSPTQLRAASRG